MDFYLYNMPELFNKTGHGLIYTAWNEFKSVLHPESFWNNGTYIYYVLEWNWSPSIMVGACVKKLS